MKDIGTSVYVKQLEDDCKKWFNMCDDLSTQVRHLNTAVNYTQSKIEKYSKEIAELQKDRQLKTEFLSRFQDLKNRNCELENLLTDIKSYLINDAVEIGEVVLLIRNILDDDED